MLDFIKNLRKKSKPLYRSGTSFTGNAGFIDISQYITSTPVGEIMKKTDERLAKKPVEVFKELISEVPKVDISNIEERLRVVKRRRKILKEEIGMDYTPDEEEALEYLEAIKKLSKRKDDADSLFPWAATSNEKIDALIKKYKLAKVDFKSYYKTIPNEAIDELERFCGIYQKFCDKTPILLLIIDDAPDEKTKERSQERKKDPILLASSPFGRWWFILGAWDKEVQYVDELLYKN